MENWKKLLLPAALGLVAAVLNWTTLSRGVTPQVFVRVTRNMSRGEVLQKADLEPIELRGDLANLPTTASLYRDVETVLNRPLTRDLKRGDLLLWQDTEPRDETLWIPFSLASLEAPPTIRPGQEIDFLLAPTADADPRATRLARTAPAADKDQNTVGPFRVQSVDGQVVTVATVFQTDVHQLDRKAQRLLAALTGAARERVAAIELRAARTTP